MDIVVGNPKLPPAPLYTEYFRHNKEFRIVVFNGKVIGTYEKVEENGEWGFIPVSYKYLKDINNDCIRAAKALHIDYVGMDVVRNSKGEYRILEANSGPIITSDSIKAFKKFIKEM
ncbi:MAG TPA: hypothetical protein VFM18_21830 [Methanosarcina sp.]|nr:hypothetical protein [Methanosarcina sp.]